MEVTPTTIPWWVGNAPKLWPWDGELIFSMAKVPTTFKAVGRRGIDFYGKKVTRRWKFKAVVNNFFIHKKDSGIQRSKSVTTNTCHHPWHRTSLSINIGPPGFIISSSEYAWLLTWIWHYFPWLNSWLFTGAASALIKQKYLKAKEEFKPLNNQNHQIGTIPEQMEIEENSKENHWFCFAFSNNNCSIIFLFPIYNIKLIFNKYLMWNDDIIILNFYW